MISIDCIIDGKFCGKCCYNTEMPLTMEDIARIESLGYSRNDFAIKIGSIYRLRNVEGKCYFLSEDNRCKIYENRPLGCRIYPVVFDLERGVILDDLCPKKDEVSIEEVKRIEPILKHLVRKIYGLKV